MINKFTNGFQGGWNVNYSPSKYNNMFNVYNNFNPNGVSGNAYLYNLNYFDKNKHKSTNMSGIQKKKEKLPDISKKELKKKLNQLDKNKDSEDLPKEILEQFSTNRKNFFQIRKDIPEVDEDEQNETENEHQTDGNKKIMFPLIFKYFSNEQ